MTDEKRVTSDTGGQKGQKLARFASIPPDVLWELAVHYGRGESKYPNDADTGIPNWQKGYDWKLTVDALKRHLALWEMGHEVDEETGSHHLIAVIWHAIALRWFISHGKGTDYRYSTRAAAPHGGELPSKDREYSSSADPQQARVGGLVFNRDGSLSGSTKETGLESVPGGTNYVPFNQGERLYDYHLGEELAAKEAGNWGHLGY